ncbi:DUF4377 domain-containing protein [filamentous cyanobacterium LEGE 11480]|uniref:DUF4377 domain-containing protein n=1 Tax=Romeriopsis navalis LEGE 11480 TaxID=2777977 RepID=A0A928VR70_9CYAN|nr:DUF4377 domain-containing protein [Romeriopsis navalis]MBE9031090.1 DUF4377 domain-containing protein [Romeriopsis navalis LEGE 11480]
MIAGTAVCHAAITTQATSMPQPLPLRPTRRLTSKFMKVTVSPARKSCQGMIPMQCLVVDGETFFSEIDGFQFEPGYNYTLMIRQNPRSPDGGIIADASIYRYQLVNVYQKTQSK